MENPKSELEECKGLLGFIGNDQESEEDNAFNEVSQNFNGNILAMTNSLQSGSTLSFGEEKLQQHIVETQAASQAI